MRALPGFIFSCSATGVTPIYTAVVRNTSVLKNTTFTARIRLYQKGNYSCVATNRFGTDRKVFSVIFTGKNFPFWKKIFLYDSRTIASNQGKQEKTFPGKESKGCYLTTLRCSLQYNSLNNSLELMLTALVFSGRYFTVSRCDVEVYYWNIDLLSGDKTIIVYTKLIIPKNFLTTEIERFNDNPT